MPFRSVFDLLWNGRRHVVMMASQIDRFGNQNFACIGPHAKPKAQLLGMRGAPGNTINHATSYWVPSHSTKVFVDEGRRRVGRRLRPRRRSSAQAANASTTCAASSRTSASSTSRRAITRCGSSRCTRASRSTTSSRRPASRSTIARRRARDARAERRRAARDPRGARPRRRARPRSSVVGARRAVLPPYAALRSARLPLPDPPDGDGLGGDAGAGRGGAATRAPSASSRRRRSVPRRCRGEIEKVKALTDQPFGVNFLMDAPGADVIIDAIIRARRARRRLQPRAERRDDPAPEGSRRRCACRPAAPRSTRRRPRSSAPT